MTDDELIADEVLSTVERLEEMVDPFEELDPLEVKVEASLDGKPREFTAVLSTGGPHIEVALYAGRVDGYWGGESRVTLIIDDEADDLLDELADYYRDHWDDNVRA